ncbi:MAG: DUF4430 domain-containing protein [Clostridia bacterium]|nr:DUF4430 domain-containing protein [Clostridia bacterium]
MKKLITLFAALAILFSLTACSSNPANEETTASTQAAATEPVTLDSSYSSFGSKDNYKHACYLEIVYRDGSTQKYGVYANEDSLGKALYSMGIIDGTEGPYGLMVESVLGLEYIYETRGYAWMLYVNGELATSGIDSIMIEDGATYSLKVETY